ncbi:MAG: hypothetical protein ABJH68_06545 [Ilumatobacter sp.]|uniref:hypothetical protein n=1 Tax=Ilumatobacter sp. TaxID=1967498 RepID=UPI00329972A3
MVASTVVHAFASVSAEGTHTSEEYVRSRRRFHQLVPWLADRYGIPLVEVSAFADWSAMLRLRRSLPRHQRRHFDGVHSALARLAIFHDQPGATDAAAEAALAERLHAARHSPSG